MLVGIAINTSSFHPDVLNRESARRGAERILEASLENAVLVSFFGERFHESLLGTVATLPTKVGQRVQILAVESRKASGASVIECAVQAREVRDAVDRLRILVPQTRPDVAVCASAQEVEALRDLKVPGVEICSIDDYEASATENTRRTWLGSQQLDQLSSAECERIVGRAVRYSDEIVIADKMLGIAAKDGRVTEHLLRFARGVSYLALVWRRLSPLAGARGAHVRLITVGGATGARGGHVDPGLARQAIVEAVRAADIGKVIDRLCVELKQDRDPPVFRDRLAGAGRRAWGIRHGLDDIGKLMGPPGKRSPTFIDPNCPANCHLLSMIMSLPEAT